MVFPIKNSDFPVRYVSHYQRVPGMIQVAGALLRRGRQGDGQGQHVDSKVGGWAVTFGQSGLVGYQLVYFGMVKAWKNMVNIW